MGRTWCFLCESDMGCGRVVGFDFADSKLDSLSRVFGLGWIS